MFQEVRKGSLGRIVASLIIAGTVEGVEKTKVCPDGVSTDLLFAAGAFHTCAAIGKQNESTSYIRTLTCWGWHDSGQTTPPDIDHITGVAAGARHSCATSRDRVAKCWGSNVHGQLDIPRHFDRIDQINYCSLGSAENTCIRVPPVVRDWEFKTIVPPTTPRPRREVTQTTAYFTTPRPNLTNGSNQTKTTNPAQTTTTPPPELIFTTPIPCPATDLKRGKELEKDNVHPYRYEEEAFHDLPLVSRKCPSPGMCMPCPMAPDLDLTIDQVLKLGDRVRIEGLQSSEQLAFNGLQGYVWELSPDAAYARITLLTGKNLSLKVGFLVQNSSRTLQIESCECLEPYFRKPECILPKGHVGVQMGWGRWYNGSSLYSRPVFRFDGKFVCSVLRMAAGGHHTCFIYGDSECANCNTGFMECFGWNEYNQSDVPQCLDGSQPAIVDFGKLDVVTVQRITKTWPPEHTRNVIYQKMLLCGDTTPPLLYKHVSAGLLHSCGITTNDRMVCWGDNRSGQLANMVVGEFGYVGDATKRFKSVCAGAYHSCGVVKGGAADGQVECWGFNEHNQSQSWADLLLEGKIEEGGAFTSVACGASHTCGTYLPPGHSPAASKYTASTCGGGGAGDSKDCDDGQKVVCWGADFAGQSSVPPAINRLIASVSLGWEHSCAATLDADTLEPNRLVCWGNTEAKLGVADGFLLEPQGQCIGLCHHCQLSTAHPPPKPHAPARLLPLAFVLFVGGGRMRA